jgi:hypothetical protein
VFGGQVAWAGLQSLLYGAETLLLVSPPVGRYIDNAEIEREGDPLRHATARS